MILQKDREIIRELVRQYAQIAGQDSQRETAKNWGRLNALDATARPTIMLDQLPWHELDINGELVCRCTDPTLREIELPLRQTLYRYKHFRADMVLSPFISYPKVFTNTGCGVEAGITTDETDHAGAETHLYIDQLPDEAALEKLHYCKVEYDADATAKRKELYEELMGDLIALRPAGVMLWEGLWDRIVFWRGAEKVLWSFYDEPEFNHKLMKKLLAIEMDMIDQYEAQNLLQAGPGSVCHCMETYVDEKKWYDIDQNHIKTSDCWISGAAQIFSEVSPAMHLEFEIEYLKPLYDRFGWINYGCCDPLDKKIDIVSQFNTVRTISASPWTDVVRQAEAMGNRYTMARKPNPAFVATGYVDEDAVRREIRQTLAACSRNNTPVTFILKDITTVGKRPQCLTDWYELVKAEIENF